MPWKPNYEKVLVISEAAARRMRGGNIVLRDAVSEALRKAGITDQLERAEYFSAVAAELGRRGREMRPPKSISEPKVESGKPSKPPIVESQLGFDFNRDERKTPRRRAA